MKRTWLFVPALVVGVLALVVTGGATAKKPASSSTPVFKLKLKPNQEVPPIEGLKADAAGSVTFDLERSGTGAITSGEVMNSRTRLSENRYAISTSPPVMQRFITRPVRTMRLS